MIRANSEQLKHTPWFARAGAASSIVPIARFIGPNVFALKGGGYGCLLALSGIDEEGLTDQELDARTRSIEGALRGMPEGSCLYQYTRMMSGFELPRQRKYPNPVTQVFAHDRLAFLEKTAAFRRIDLHWCLTLEPPTVMAFEQRPKEHAAHTSRMLADLQKTATILEGHLGSAFGLRLLDNNATFQFFSYLFNLEEWAAAARHACSTPCDCISDIFCASAAFSRFNCSTSLLVAIPPSSCSAARLLLAVAFCVLAARYWPTAVKQSGEIESEASIMASSESWVLPGVCPAR